MMSQQSQQPGTVAIVVELAEIELSYGRIDEADSKGTGRRIGIALLDQR